MKTILDLGWENAGGKTGEIIRTFVDGCRALKHVRVQTQEGMNGTTHVTLCDECGYIFRTDSGD